MTDKVVVVAHGRFRLVTRPLRESSREILLRFAKQREILGISQLLDRPRTTDLFAVDRAGAVVIPVNAIRDCVARTPSVAMELLRQHHVLLDELVEEVVSLRTDLFAERLVLRIVQLIDDERMQTDEAPLVLDVGQHELAAMTGGTAPDVSKKLRPFVVAGALRWRAGRLVILDVEALRKRVADLGRKSWRTPESRSPAALP